MNSIAKCYYKNGVSPLIKFIDSKTLNHVLPMMYEAFSNSPADENDPRRGKVVKIYNPTACIKIFIDVKKILENIFRIKLYESYWYSTLYYKNSFMVSHYDRTACELSVSLNLYQDAEWELHVLDYNKIDHMIKTPPGYGIIYDGVNCPHWRDNYTGKEYAQLFLHYLTKPPKILL